MPLPIALTGASGFLGSHIALALQRAGLPVRGVVRDPGRGAWLGGQGIPLAIADLSDPSALARAFEGAGAVVANAAMGSYRGRTLDDFLRANVTGTEHTLRAAAAVGVPRVVLISTVAVYRTRILRVIGEDAERYGHRRRPFVWSDLSTDWRYALSKCLGEDRAWELAGELGLSLTVLRPGPVYGARDTRFTGRLVRLLGRRLALVPGIGVPLVHAGDVASAVATALARPNSAGRAYNLAGPPAPLPSVLRLLVRLAGHGPRVLALPLPLWVAYDTTAAQRDLGFSPRPLEQGLREVLDGHARDGV